MQLKLDRSEETKKGFFGSSVIYKLRAALTVSSDEEENMKRLGLWKRAIRPMTREEEREGDYDLECFALRTFKDLAEGFTVVGDLPFIEEREQDLVKGCKMVKHHLEGGQAGERIIDI